MDTNQYRHVNWGPLTATLGSVLLILGPQLLVGFGLTIILLLVGWDATKIDAWFSSGNNSQFILNSAVAVVTLSALFWYLSFKKAHPRDIGLVKPKLLDIGYIILGAVAYVVLYLSVVSIVANLVPTLNTEQAQELGFSRDTAEKGLILIFISLVVLPPIIEEIVVRGFMLSGLRTKLAFWPAAIISSGLFGLAHLLGGEGGSVIWIATLDTFVLGLVLSYLREKTGSLWPAIGLHALKNFVAFTVLFVL